ncbi:flavin reductase family protein [Aliirhizobium cellulosilyticum]|uniref:Flavin reductase (DIM6/NTAB) family NADH-FMN oxidoreductase RutF n=1 Tax=Aliirhizobium cellulosilyticum TaxID=393664 RepID=A0A7W6WS48_9HYPH|nr:flavin reductase family protein [Rhizobium cellulosilyticum]MBB4351107.1 flavin reductase (DIM6/NTAB) family NADH-FMN oxidoreductase RutF [Rhizobium cellulosilyticum]MBB4414317.1 flavin reductase (DIM6/NTAB) family NADH-FMN oxidoreductase RutF [Rhizobium cellulosilyticum]MBB4448933.1 flavin reductase (DIM6/NTAB) family NADH-FMN oxidoreductase RutF [Rhizobium cellulosilyticum]
MKELPASQAYRVLEPGPIVMVSTSDNGKPNVMTMGFHMMIQHDPPLIGCVIGPWDHSYQALRKTGECVIAVPGLDLAETVVDVGNCSGDRVDKFQRYGLKTRPAKDVSAPLLSDCLANIECRVVDTRLSDPYNLVILEATRIWINENRKERRMLHHRGDGTFTVDGGTLDLRDRMVKWRHLP